MKKILTILLTLTLILPLLAGCGSQNSESQSNSASQSNSQSQSQEASEPENTGESEPETQGPVEINKVIYDANGIKLTVLSYEDNLAKLDDTDKYDPVFSLDLQIERAGDQHNTVKICEVGANGFRYTNGESFLIGPKGGLADWLVASLYRSYLSESDQEEVVVGMLPSYVKYLDLKTVGEIGFVLQIDTDDGYSFYDTASLDLGKESDPKCSVSFGEQGSAYEYGYVKVTNNMDTPMLVSCIVTMFDKDGKPLYTEDYDYNTGNTTLCHGFRNSFYIKNGAKDEPVAVLSTNSMPQGENGENVSWREISDVRIQYVSAIPVKTEDLSSIVSYECEGRWEESDNFMVYRCTWPEEYVKLQLKGTCLVYKESGELAYIIPIDDILSREQDFRENYHLADPETGAIDYFAIDRSKNSSDPEYTFDIYLNYVFVPEN